MRIGLLFGSLACLACGTLAAQSAVEISRAVYVERASGSAASGVMRAVEPASSLRRGDKVVLVVEWQAPRGRDGFTVSSRVPRNLAFQRSSRDDVQVSVDGGARWGSLQAMRVGSRRASPEDVTNLRWRIPSSLAARGSGIITYSAIVR